MKILITALDITWMFLQFSVTPVSISVMSAQRAQDLPWDQVCHFTKLPQHVTKINQSLIQEK